jgi:hypothetical protein
VPTIEVPGHGLVEFPDTMSDDDIVRAIERDLSPVSQEGSGSRARSRALEQTKGLATEALPAMVGHAFGDTEYRDKKLEEYADRMARTERVYPADVPSFTDIKGLGDAGTYIWEAVNEGLVSMGPSLLAGGVGGLGARFIATQAGKRIVADAVRRGATEEAAEKAVALAASRAATATKIGTATGAGVASATQNIPETFAGIDGESLGVALTAGGFKSVLDVAPQMRLLGNLFGREVAEKALLKRIGKEGVKSGAFEAGTEGAQTATDIAAEAYMDKNPELFSRENLIKVVDGTLKGLFPGTIAGGASALAQRPRQTDVPESVETVTPQPVETPAAADPKTLTPQGPQGPPPELGQRAPSAIDEFLAPGETPIPEETTQRIDDLEKKVAKAVEAVETEPTEAQKEAGNYRKGHLNLHGLDIAVENPEGSIRRGQDRDGKPWEVEMPAHYGYVKRTNGKDGDQVDVYIGGSPQSDYVVVVDQFDPKTGKFDEHKAVLGVNSYRGALDIYDRAFSDGSGPQRRKEATPTTVDDFKKWLKDGDTTKPFSESQYASQARVGTDAVPQVRQIVRDAARQVLGPELSKRVQIDDIIPVETTGVKEEQLKAADAGRRDLLGVTEGSRLVRISLAQPTDQLRQTTFHEAFHLLDNLRLFTPEERRTFDNDEPAIRQFLQRAVDRLPYFKGLNVDEIARSPDELRAYGFEAYTALRNANAATPGLTGGLRRLFERGYQFLRKVANGLKGKGFRTADDVFKRVESGEVASRFRQEPAVADDVVQARLASTIAEDVKAAFKGDTGDPVSYAGDIGIFEKLFNHPTFLADKYPALRPLVDTLGKIRSMRSATQYRMWQDMKPFFDLSAPERLRVETAADLFNQIQTEPTMVGDKIVAPDGTVLAGKEAQALVGIRKALNGVWDQYLEAMQRAMGGQMDPALLAELQKRKNSGYIPQMRFGNIGFRVVDRDSGQTVWFQTIDASPVPGQVGRNITQRRINAIRARLKKEKFSDANFVVEPAFELTKDSWKDKNLLDAVGLVEATMMAFNLPKDSDVKAVLDQIQTELKKKGFKAHLAKRRNTPGYINDENRGNYLAQALPTYAARSSAYIARNYYGPELQKAATEFGGKKDEDGNIIRPAQPKLGAYANKLVEYVSSPNEEFQFLKNLSFHWLLGANISSAAINLTQLMHSTLPYLTMLGGAGRAAKQVGTAFKDAVSTANLLQVSEGGIDWNRRPAGISGAEWAAMRKAHEEGLLFPVTTQELAGLANRDYGSFVPKIGVKGVKVMEAMMLAFNSVENINRITTWLAAYRMAQDPAMRQRADGILKNTRWADQPKTPDLLARAAVEDTQFVMGRENRPEFMRGAMALPTQFMSFPVQMLEQFIKAGKYYGGDGVFSTGPGKTMLALMALGVMSTAGVWGLPFAEPLKKAIEGIYRLVTGTRLDVDKEMREAIVAAGLDKNFGEAISKGLGRLAGIDISRRTSLEIVPTDLFSGNARDFLGPTGGVVLGSLADAHERFNQGQNLLGFAALMPTFLKNVITARENLRQGVVTGQGNVLLPPDRVGVGQALTKGVLGFTPAPEAQARELVAARQGLTQNVKDLRESYTDRLVKARREAQLASQRQNEEGFRSAMEDFRKLLGETREYDRKRKPDERLNINLKTVTDRVRRDLAGLSSKEQVKKMAKNARSAAKELSQIYPGGGE